VNSEECSVTEATVCTDVLIVGAGPVGLSLGVALRSEGVGFLLADAGDGQVDHPRVGTVGPRSMELFRRWGLAKRIRGAGWPEDHPLDVAWVTAVGGHEIHRIDFGTTATRPEPAYTPEPEQVCPQHWLMPLLFDELGHHPDGPVRLGHRVEHVDQDGDRVVATVRDLASDETFTVEAKYLAACDGASSPTRKACGVDAPARHRPRVFRNILFRAPGLRERLGDAAALVHFITSPEMLRYPLRAMDGDALYRLTASGEDASTAKSPEELVGAALALDVPFEVLSESIWHLTHRIAERYRDGRIFFVGDSAHTLSPSGGYGMNTGIADAADLAWKLSATLAGWAGPGLLDSYETERKPVAETSLERSNENLERTMRRQLPPEIALDDEAGERVRRVMGERMAQGGVRREFESPEMHFGYRYDSPVIAADPDEAGDETWLSSALAGARAPHAYLEPGRSTIDLFGSSFVLVCFEPSADLDALRGAFAARSVPLAIEVVRDEEIARLYGRPFVLVRPDGHVAWRGAEPPKDADALVSTVRGATSA
jgi:2-polyprenyl-6-methoxyphenol hydroxylase-like FAD-dependent oxidoreductase